MKLIGVSKECFIGPYHITLMEYSETRASPSTGKTLDKSKWSVNAYDTVNNTYGVNIAGGLVAGLVSTNQKMAINRYNYLCRMAKKAIE